MPSLQPPLPLLADGGRKLCKRQFVFFSIEVGKSKRQPCLSLPVTMLQSRRVERPRDDKQAMRKNRREQVVLLVQNQRQLTIVGQQDRMVLKVWILSMQSIAHVFFCLKRMFRFFTKPPGATNHQDDAKNRNKINNRTHRLDCFFDEGFNTKGL